MIDRRWVRLAACDQFPLREGRAVRIGTREIAVFNLGDRLLATDNQCPHRGGPLCDGIVTGSSVVCPLHAWKTNLETGAVERPASAADHCVETYPTRVENGVVLVALPEKWGRESFFEDTLPCPPMPPSRCPRKMTPDPIFYDHETDDFEPGLFIER